MSSPHTVQGPLEQFQSELLDLINKWAGKPEDDLLTYPEMVGSLEIMKFRLLSQQKDREEENEED